MTHVRLFGVDVVVPSQGPIGGLVNTLRVELSNDSTRLSVSFAGAHPFGSAKFEVSLPCTVVGDEVRLTPTPNAGTVGSLQVDMPLSLGGVNIAPMTVAVSEAGELVFNDSGFLLRGSLKRLNIVAEMRTLDWRSDGSWAGFLIAIDMAARLRFTPLPTAATSELRILDVFRTRLLIPVVKERQQPLAIHHVTATPTEIEVVAVAKDGLLLIHPDILSTAASQSPQENDLLYQHALVNGALHLKISGTIGSERQFRWGAHPLESVTPAMLLFRLTDEHGQPLMAEAADGFPLSARRGTSIENGDSSDRREWEFTNPALHVYSEAELPVTLQSIDPGKAGSWSEDHEKRWLDERGLVVPHQRSPREIHGLAKGTFLRRLEADVAPISGAAIATEAVTDPTLGHIFTRSDLSLPIDAGSWRLMAQLEERDVIPAAGVGDRVGYREAAAKNSVVRLPMIDTSYALANLADPKGRVKEGLVLKNAKTWLDERDAQFAGGSPSHFELPVTGRQTHVAGFRLIPEPGRGFSSILDRPPGQALKVAATARTGAWLNHQKLHYVHGGVRREDADDALTKIVDESHAGFGEHLVPFTSFWNALAPAESVVEARAALRAAMGLERRKDLVENELRTLLAQVKGILHGGRRVDGLEPQVMERLRRIIEPATDVATFTNLWKTTPDQQLIALFELAWAGSGPAAYRQAVDLITESIDLVPVALRGTLKDRVKSFDPSFEDLRNGFPTPAYAGLNEAVAIFSQAWSDLAALEESRLRFGASFTPDLYRLLLDSAHRADLEATLRHIFVSDPFKVSLFEPGFVNLAGAIANRWNHSPTLAALKAAHGNSDWSEEIFRSALNASGRLELFRAVVEDVVDFYSKLRFDPPEYLFFSSRVRTSIGKEEQEFAEGLWNQKFRLASLGGANHWSFVLDGESSVIVKLTGTRSVGEILEEIQKSYGTSNLADPLGLGMPLAEFARRLDPSIRQKLWRGVVVVRPTADIKSDPQLSTLTGLTRLPIVYAAVGGARPDLGADEIDVYAQISHARDPFAVTGTPQEDLTVTLIRFDATIRNTRLVAGEVIFRLDVRNVFGRDTTNEARFPPLMLRGTVPRNKGDVEASSFEFSAWFEKPQEYPVDIAFIKSFVFKSLRVSTSRGQTAIDIDADVNLQKWKVDLGGLGFDVGPDTGKTAILNLQNFRILLPKPPEGVSIPIGLPRLLNFELPAVSFGWPDPRPLNLWNGIELAPIGMGLLRRAGEAVQALQDLLGRYQWLFGAPPEGDIFQLPYLRCSIHFGKLPSFGGTSLSRLNLELIIALIIRTPGGLPEVAIGLGGLDAKEISVDLFGVIKLEVERLILDRFKTLLDQKHAVALLVDNPRLTILGWSPLPQNDRLKFLFAHGETRADGRAVLGFYTHQPSDGFFQVFWLLVAHNVVISRKITDYLLHNDRPEEAHALLDGFVDTTAKTIDGRIVEDDSWLFGASFALRNIVEQGTLVLHDQHYYGISLRGKAIEQLFGVKRLELSYIPGPTRAQDRFRACFRLAALDLIGRLRSGDIAIEWGFNWDFLLDFGFPWKSGTAYQWERAFSLPMGTYEAKFGLYFEKKTQIAPNGSTELTLAAGAGFYLGYYFGFGTPGRFVWVQAGIGVFAILEGTVTFALPPGEGGVGGLIKSTIKEIVVRGVIGIFAYGEGGIEVWVISARFRVSVQAAIAGELHYLPGGSSTLRYAATLNAQYSASCRVGCGFFSFTFSVSGVVGIEVSGQALLN